MTDAEKVALVKHFTDETDDTVISAFLSLAGNVLYSRCDPYKTTSIEDFLEDNASTQVKAAAYYLNKRGWDFELGHSENGVSRQYEAGDLPASILREITPKVGVPKRTVVEEPTVEPIDEPIVEPIDEPIVEPTDEPIVEPIDEPIDVPVDEPNEP